MGTDLHAPGIWPPHVQKSLRKASYLSPKTLVVLPDKQAVAVDGQLIEQTGWMVG